MAGIIGVRDKGMSRDVRRRLWLVLALTGQALVVAAFLWMPWAEGRGAFDGRDFAGPELARLVRNTDVVLGNRAGGPAAFLMVLALYAVPVAALTAAVLLIGANATHNPSGAIRAAAVCSVLPLAIGLVTAGLLAADLGQRPLLAERAGPGVAMAQIGAVAAATGALALLRLRRTGAGPPR